MVFKRSQGVKRQAFRSILPFTGSTREDISFFFILWKVKAGEGSFSGISLTTRDFKSDAAAPHGVRTVHGNGVSGDWMSGKRGKSLGQLFIPLGT